MEMRATPDAGLPCVLATSVIRSTRQGASHGGVYLVDLATRRSSLVVDWNDGTIDWAGRGGDRGLRGIAFEGERVFLAASDEVFVYDTALRPITSIRSPYLRHCHEITIEGELLYLTSTGFDAVLVFDLRRWRFTHGVCLRTPRPSAARRAWYKGLKRAAGRVLPPAALSALLRVHPFDPEVEGGPEPLDLFHINSVSVRRDAIDIGGTQLDGLFRIEGGKARRLARLPRGTHNARFEAGTLIYNDTEMQRVVLRTPDGEERHSLPEVDPARIEHGDVGRDHARAGFARGLCVLDDGRLAAGSSPATVTVFERGGGPALTVNLTMDVRNAIHGLEVWPFDRRLADFEARHGVGEAPASGEIPVEAALPLTAS